MGLNREILHLRMPKPEQRGPRFARNFDEIVEHVKKAIERGVPVDDVEYLSRLTGLTTSQAEAALRQLCQDRRSVNGSAVLDGVDQKFRGPAG